jgi:lipopolysaccharide/colanic/teichoic acid biosynthesis glycosyltransferase
VALLLLVPVMATAAIAVKLSSPGPVLYRQSRVGRDGRVFDLLKFRSMRVTEEFEDFVPEPGKAPGGVEGVDRRTGVGRVLRRTAVDELPQLLNVLRGEMSLVGPRPERVSYARTFGRHIDRYYDRHRVRPGLTGWAQVNGCRGQTSITDRVEFDNFYIENASHLLDFKILLMTFTAILRGDRERLRLSP